MNVPLAPGSDDSGEPGASGRSLHGALLARLRDYIVEGNLADGARVPERRLCELFAVSRTPLREALKVLASEGLVDLLPNRGARVSQVGARDLAALFDLLGGLAALAGRLACENLTDEAFAGIERQHHTLYGHYLRRDLQGYADASLAIHASLVNLAANAPLSAAYAGVAGRLRRARDPVDLALDRRRWSMSVREHEDILDALRRRAGLDLGDILFHHLRNERRAASGRVARADAMEADLTGS